MTVCGTANREVFDGEPSEFVEGASKPLRRSSFGRGKRLTLQADGAHSASARGVELLDPTTQFLDLTPLGRQEG